MSWRATLRRSCGMGPRHGGTMWEDECSNVGNWTTSVMDDDWSITCILLGSGSLFMITRAERDWMISFGHFGWDLGNWRASSLLGCGWLKINASDVALSTPIQSNRLWPRDDDMEEIFFIYVLVSVLWMMCLCEMVRCGVGVLWNCVVLCGMRYALCVFVLFVRRLRQWRHVII